MIRHRPQFDVQKVIQYYEQKDKVTIKYVCTSDLDVSDIPMDIFYRESPHPEFGNRYFGLYAYNGNAMICNADNVEGLSFAMITDDAGTYHYSQSHHDYKQIGRKMIDGGRKYVRVGGRCELFKVKDGEMVKI